MVSNSLAFAFSVVLFITLKSSATVGAWSLLKSSPVAPRRQSQPNTVSSSKDGSSSNNNNNGNVSRRSLIQTAFFSAMAVGSTAISTTAAAQALDMDAFASQQLLSNDGATATMTSNSNKNTAVAAVVMSDDEAMCRFGQPSQRKGDACVRAGLPTAPSKKGGVDAYGQVDRYVVCVYDACVT